MKTDRIRQVGIDRIIRLSWLDKVALLASAENEASAISEILKEDLAVFFRSSNICKRGALDKTVTNLLKVWIRVPNELEALRKDGIELINSGDGFKSLPVQWGMMMAVYPFWSAVAEQIGRLLRLQESAALLDIQRRICENYGERQTVSRATQRVMRSFVDWGVLEDTKQKGIYTLGPVMALDEVRTVGWLAEAFLRTRERGTSSLKEFVESPCLFPFQLINAHASIIVQQNERLEIFRHGLDDDLIMLKKRN